MIFIYVIKLIINPINWERGIWIKFLIILLSFFTPNRILAQETICSWDTSFATSYYYPQEEIVFFAGTIITEDNATLMVSQSRDRFTGKKAILLAKVDHKGTPLWSRKIEAEFTKIAAMLAINDGYVFALSGFTQGERKFLFLLCLDDNGQIKWQYKYQISNLDLPDEYIHLQDAGNGSVDVMVSVWGAVHPAHTAIDGDFFYFQVDKNGQPNTKAFIFDGGYGNYEFFSYLVGIRREVNNAGKINMYLLNQVSGGQHLRTYPSFSNGGIYGYSHFQLDLNLKSASVIKYFCPGINDVLPPDAVLPGPSNIEPNHSFAIAADGSTTFAHRNATSSYPQIKFITFKNDTIAGIVVADSLHDAPPAFSLSAVGAQGKSAYLIARRTVGNSIDFTHFGIVQNGKVLNQKIARISENAFLGNVNINTAGNGSEYLTILSRPDGDENMQSGASFYRLSIESNGTNICNSTDSVVATSYNIPFTSLTLPAPTIAIENVISTATSLIIKEVEANFVKKCEFVSNCDSIELIAPDSVCIGAPFTVIVRKDKNCRKSISLNSSPNMQQIQQTNDSTYVYKINHPGNSLLNARFRDCDNGKATKIIFCNNFNSTPIQLPFHDTTLCIGSSLIINAPFGYKSYLWNRLDTSQSINVNKSGWQFIEAEGYCGTYSIDSVKIDYDSSFLKLSPLSKGICNGDTISLEIKSNAVLHNYTWHPAQDIKINSQHTTILAWPSVTMSYNLEALSEFNCPVGDTVTITVFKFSPGNVLSNTLFDLCKGDSIKIQPNQQFAHYLWSTGDTTSFVSIKQSGNFYVVVYDEHFCSSRFPFKVDEKICTGRIFFPSVFSPNHDGLNDEYKAIQASVAPQFFELEIFNRWGQIVFSGRDIQKGWDGNFKGSKQSAGAYVWICRYQFPGQKMNIETGNLLLIN